MFAAEYTFGPIPPHISLGGAPPWRHSKRWPLTSEAYNAINSDDDAPDFEKRVKQAKPINEAKPIFNTPVELPEPDEIPMDDAPETKAKE